MLITLFVAGFDTSKNQLILTMNQLIDRPEMYRRCGEDLAYCRKVTEESLRYSAIVSKFRAAAKDFDYDGQSFRKGDTLVLSSPLANRDPAFFADPMDFILIARMPRVIWRWARRSYLPRPAHRPRANPGRVAPDRATPAQSAPQRRGWLAADARRLGTDQPADRLRSGLNEW